MIPSTYSEWCKVFDEIEMWEIGHCEELLIQNCESGSIEWLDGLAQLITIRLVDLINNRLKKLNEFYNKRITLAFNPFDTTNLLIIYRKELIFLKRLGGLNILPDDIKTSIITEIMNCAKKSQKSLDESAKQDLSGELKRIVLGYRIDNI